jgi:hypothetical protein
MLLKFGCKAVTTPTLLLRSRVDAAKSQNCPTSTLRACPGELQLPELHKRQVFPHHLHRIMADFQAKIQLSSF